MLTTRALRPRSATWKSTRADGRAGGRSLRRRRTGRAGAVLAGTAAFALLLTAGTASAHGFGQRYDLPVPLGLWLAGAATAVSLSFVVIGVFVRGAPGLRGYPRVNLLRWRIGRLVAGRGVRLAARTVSVAFLALVVAAGFLGDQTPTRNLAPVAVWVLWWVGFAYVSALLGNLWAVVNPWRTAFEWAEAIFTKRRPQRHLALDRPYPSWLGAWPAVVGFLAFAWVELVFLGRAVPASLAFLIALYSVVTWAGMFVFGPSVWLRNADPFARAFEVLARFAPTEVRVTDPSACAACPAGCRDRRGDCVNCDDCYAIASDAHREWNLRPFAVGLLRNPPVSFSMAAFVVVLLSTVTFDGLTATPAWGGLENALYASLPIALDVRLTVIDTLGLLAAPGLLLALYALVARRIASAGRSPGDGAVERAFVLSLVPIAIGYHLAHYLTYLLIQGQFIVPLASDPLGYGWNLFGTAGYRPDIGIVGARFAWYTAVTAIVLGHIFAVFVAHLIALREFPDRRLALRSQFPMLGLMVGYTMVSLWIIAQPIVETSPRG